MFKDDDLKIRCIEHPNLLLTSIGVPSEILLLVSVLLNATLLICTCRRMSTSRDIRSIEFQITDGIYTFDVVNEFNLIPPLPAKTMSG